ncbi:hypothetical protein [Paracoccus sanguinis]|uniref:hypothetical protein n=1 Tax=Paracoccus sanguinis TaxID=1545044 RepID=UPI00314512ED
MTGEDAVLEGAIRAGWLKREVVAESLLSFRRAGCDGILTYYAPMVAEMLAARTRCSRARSGPASSSARCGGEPCSASAALAATGSYYGLSRLCRRIAARCGHSWPHRARHSGDA